jgi:hypothetical protein
VASGGFTVRDRRVLFTKWVAAT